jgi:hypothetical protein
MYNKAARRRQHNLQKRRDRNYKYFGIIALAIILTSSMSLQHALRPMSEPCLRRLWALLRPSSWHKSPCQDTLPLDKTWRHGQPWRQGRRSRLVRYVLARAGSSNSWCNVCRVLRAERATSRNCGHRHGNAARRPLLAHYCH